ASGMMIQTANLRLAPFSPEHLLALIERPQEFEKCSGLRAAEGLRDMYVSGDVSPTGSAGSAPPVSRTLGCTASRWFIGKVSRSSAVPDTKARPIRTVRSRSLTVLRPRTRAAALPRRPPKR